MRTAIAGDRVQADPLRGEGQSQQEPDDGQDDPERPRPSPAPQPERGEQGVGGHDEQADVDVVHRDPRLDEEHPVDEDEDGGDDRDLAAPEEDPGQQEDEAGHERAGDDPRDPPGEGVVAGVDRGERPVGGRDEDRLPVAARVIAVRVERPRLRREGQAGVGEDRVPVGLDDVDRRRRPVGVRPRTWTIWVGFVEEHPPDLAGHPERLVEPRPVLRPVSGRRTIAIRSSPRVTYRLGLSTPVDRREVEGAGLRVDRVDELAGRRGDELHAVRRRRRRCAPAGSP